MNHQFFTVWLITSVVGLRHGVVTLDPHHEVFSVHGLTVPLIAVSALAWISFSFLAFVSFRYSTENKQRIRVYYAQRWYDVSHVLNRFRYLYYWITTMFLCCFLGNNARTYTLSYVRANIVEPHNIISCRGPIRCGLRGYLEQTHNSCLEIIMRRHLDSILLWSNSSCTRLHPAYGYTCYIMAKPHFMTYIGGRSPFGRLITRPTILY